MAAGELPGSAAEMISRIGPAEVTSTISAVDGASVYRSDYVPEGQTNGITVQAVDLTLGEPASLGDAAGKGVEQATANYPTTVLGSITAERLGITNITGTQQVHVS